MEFDAVYEQVQSRWLGALARFGPDAGAAAVPACPAWTVHDVVAHVAGLADDVVAGSLPELELLEQWRDQEVAAQRDSMTAGQVERFADTSLEALVAHWRDRTRSLSPMLRGQEAFPGAAWFGLGAVLVTDLAVHAHDVLAALHAPRMGDGVPVAIAVATYGFGVDYRVRQLGLDALVLRSNGKERVLGDPDGPVGATVTAERVELLRALAGRRSRAQIAALDWQGDPGPYLAILPAYGERHDPLED